MNVVADLVYRALRDPGILGSLPHSEWDRLLRQARRAGVLSRLAILSKGTLAENGLSERARDQLLSARMVAAHHARTIRWEVNRIRRALRPTGERFVLLKGAAYEIANVPSRAGRLASDVDILVPRAKLGVVEEALVQAGWTALKLDPYDQRYYRQWMHELPPLRHSTRGTVVDVHHNILPTTARFRPEASKLLESAVWIDDGMAVLAPEDMVLHTATHLFADGDLAGGLREVIDLDAQLRHFPGADADFWDRLAPRARVLHLERPLFYALRACRRLLETPIPEAVTVSARAGRPTAPTARIMDALVDRALLPDTEGVAWSGGLALWMLYARSHWMRMPPWLLARHLTRKAIRRWFGEGD
jgi:hypothetical protein